MEKGSGHQTVSPPLYPLLCIRAKIRLYTLPYEFKTLTRVLGKCLLFPKAKGEKSNFKRTTLDNTFIFSASSIFLSGADGRLGCVWLSSWKGLLLGLS